MPLLYISREAHRSQYVDTATGSCVFLANGAGRIVQLVAFDELDLRELRARYVRELRAPVYLDTFAELLLQHTFIGLYEILDRLTACDDCDVVLDCYRDDTYSTSTGTVCGSCIDDYCYCDSCCEYGRDSTTYVHGSHYCDSCVEDLPQCAGCGTYDIDEYASHCDDCGHGCDCQAARPSFAIGELRADEKGTVTTAAGVISREGMTKLSDAVYRYAATLEPTVPGAFVLAPAEYDRRQAARDARQESRNKLRDLHYSGLASYMGDAYVQDGRKWHKRFAQLAWTRYATKVPAELVAELGTIASTYSAGSDLLVSLSRADLTGSSAAAWYHEGSCWWQSYAHSLCTLKGHGGIGMRTWDEYGTVSGRAWVLPITAEGEIPDSDADAAAYVVFNGYGQLSNVAMARTLAAIVGDGATFARVSFPIYDSVMYVNGQAGYVVGAPDVLAQLGETVRPDLYVPC